MKKQILTFTAFAMLGFEILNPTGATAQTCQWARNIGGTNNR